MKIALRIPPVLLVLIAMAAMWATALALPEPAFRLPGGPAIPVLVGLVGAAVAIAGVVEFRRAGTTVDPLHPEKSARIVETGVYRFSRNPMYLGFGLALLAMALWLSAFSAVVWVVVFACYVTRFQILPEERALRARFGAEFERYAGAVRRWL